MYRVLRPPRDRVILDSAPCWLLDGRGVRFGTKDEAGTLTPQTYDKKTLNWALGQEFLKAYIRIPYIRAYSGVLKG